jgi:hypothetical protein
MKLNCDALGDWIDRKVRERILRLAKRHRFFAWYPVRISHGDCRWLEHVWRYRKSNKFWIRYSNRYEWEYRAIQP